MGAASFKIVIVGGGPAGLVAAHALHHAGIDFVVLERRQSVVDPSGASVVLSPPAMRVLSQFGLREQLEEAGVELSHYKSFTSQGYKFRDTTAIQLLKECLGAAQYIYHRPDLIRVLYEGLSAEAKAKVLTGKKVTTVAQDNDANTVQVSCADGSTYTGSVVIGADGVHSRTRQQLRQSMVRDGQPPAACDDEKPYECTYRMLWCSFPRPESTAPGLGGETQGVDRTLALMVSRKTAMIICYEKLPHPTRERIDYTEKDVARMYQSFADWPVTETLRFRDVFDSRTAGMANLPEGIIKNFSKGRVCLVSDACHRYTPNAGLGLNNGIQDVVALCNEIHAAVKHAGPAREPSQEEVERVFSRYVNQRLKFMKGDLQGSALLTRLQAWASTFHYVMSRYVLAPDWVLRLGTRYKAVPTMRKLLVLDYIEAEEPYVGTVSWVHPIKMKAASTCT
ncbi:FAD-dependent monooxygenase sdnN [Naviculisporaceae sp. PSN 640]